MLNLQSATAKLGRSINQRTETHGEELVPAIDVRVTEVVLDPDAIDALLGEDATDTIFSTDDKVRYPWLTTIRVPGKLEGMRVVLEVPPVMGEAPSEEPVVLTPVAIKSVELEAKEGATCVLAFMVQCSGYDPAVLIPLSRWMGHELLVSVERETQQPAIDAKSAVDPQASLPV